MAKQRVGYVGVGFMGGPMARRLLAAGYEVVVYNRSRPKLEPVLAAGAVEAASPAEVARECEVTFLCVTNADAVREAALGADGLLAGGSAGKLAIDMSSIEPQAARELAQRFREEKGMGWLDAPVSGGPVGAENGTLAIMVGGVEADFARARPHLAELGRATLVGPSGAGQTAKLINQCVVGCQIMMMAEICAFARAAGVDPAKLPEALKGGRADSLVMQQFLPRMASGDLTPTAQVLTMVKDVNMALAQAAKTLTPMPITALIAQLQHFVVAHGHGAEDPAAVVKLYSEGAW
jgi:3-hydroxyisobutyrate dehydrogenase